MSAALSAVARLTRDAHADSLALLRAEVDLVRRIWGTYFWAWPVAWTPRLRTER